jgi:hypothetical protein
VVPFFQMGAHGVDHERTLLHQLLAKVFAFWHFQTIKNCKITKIKKKLKKLFNNY